MAKRRRQKSTIMRGRPAAERPFAHRDAQVSAYPQKPRNAAGRRPALHILPGNGPRTGSARTWSAGKDGNQNAAVSVAGGQLAAPAGRLDRLRTWAVTRDRTFYLMLAMMLLACVAHAANMLHFPSFVTFEDEGVYAQQAWSVLREGRLSPYTYFYDHAPAGWILTALWMVVTGLHTFGSAIDSGRVLVAVLHVLMVPLLYRSTSRLSRSQPAGWVAAALFSFSPLAIYFQRLLLLDNLMMFWLLLSIDQLLDPQGRLSRLALSGVAFGLAMLTKETALFLLPALVLMVAFRRRRHHGRFGWIGWGVPMAAVLSLYPLYAVLKGELLPAGLALRFTILNVQLPAGHVSLLDALRWQVARGDQGTPGTGTGFWNLVMTDWLRRDPILPVAGAAGIAANLVLGVRNWRSMAIGLLGLLPVLYLARGGLVFAHYVIFAVPFLAMNAAALLALVTSRMPRLAAGAAAAAMILAVVGAGLGSGRVQELYTQKPDLPARQALGWALQNLPHNATVITTDSFWTDLHEPGGGLGGFPNAHGHWKVLGDPAVSDGILHNDWRNVDYLIIPEALKAGLQAANNRLALDALAHADLVKRWGAGGDAVEIYRVNKATPAEGALLDAARKTVDSRFNRNGAYAEPDGTVTSEAQGYALEWGLDRDLQGILAVWYTFGVGDVAQWQSKRLIIAGSSVRV